MLKITAAEKRWFLHNHNSFFIGIFGRAKCFYTEHESESMQKVFLQRAAGNDIIISLFGNTVILLDENLEEAYDQTAQPLKVL